MDKNNDIPVNKVNKWDYGVVDMSLWHLKDEFDALVDMLNGVYGIDVFDIEELTGDTYSSMDKVLERFNELEAAHHKACGMISQYEEENRNLKSELDIKTDECDALISRVFNQDEEYTKLEEENGELRSKFQNFRSERDRNAYLLDGLCRTLADKGIFCEWDEAAHKWHLYDEISTCTSCRQHFEDELKIRCEEIDGKNKLIDELKQKIEDLESKNKCLEFKFRTYKTFGYVGHTHLLKDKIEALEKENKVLKDTIEKDGEFGRNVGECVADSIREGCDKGVYKLHPLTRIDIHVEETNNMPMTFDRHAIPRIAVMFNNTQTEMERDTAQHECEELKTENNNLTTDNKRLNDAVDAWRKENKKLKGMVKSLRRAVSFLDGEG